MGGIEVACDDAFFGAWICSLRELLLAKEPTREIDTGMLNNPRSKAKLMSRRGSLTNL